MDNYISIKQAAQKWNISERRIQKLCMENRIPEAVKFGRAWAIPRESNKPTDKRLRNNIINSNTKHSSGRIFESIFGEQIRILSDNDNCIVYLIENTTGNGVITRYQIFDGIEVYYSDIHMLNDKHNNNNTHNDIMEINHCRVGRFECTFKSGSYAYLGDGDLSINMLSNQTDSTYFPLSHYHGISVIIDIPIATQTIKKISSTFGNIEIDLAKIRDKMCANNECFIMRSTDSIQHIFSELYNVPEKLREGYIKIKVIELLMFLNIIDIESQQKQYQYFYKAQVDTIKEMRNYLTNRLHKRFTLSELSQKFHIPLTSMKTCFKGIYGTPINTYMREYRLQAAASMIRETNDSIALISEKVGYESPTKFSIAFQKVMGLSPSEYRKTFCLQGTEYDL
ncbi:helix-turn-helix domain-containing protein [Vallitalea guaymasensis]|uniref:helix-turn-helix domain-containing protein n=1 Tax=Vallitalea guaymasensis TaxID=1185412 RepID=UPI00272AE60D|nr:helix-turn-helix domain-containing protein [Vallitalea guaymasensis]